MVSGERGQLGAHWAYAQGPQKGSRVTGLLLGHVASMASGGGWRSFFLFSPVHLVNTDEYAIDVPLEFPWLPDLRKCRSHGPHTDPTQISHLAGYGPSPAPSRSASAYARLLAEHKARARGHHGGLQGADGARWQSTAGHGPYFLPPKPFVLYIHLACCCSFYEREGALAPT